jgi:hypothetical protein
MKFRHLVEMNPRDIPGPGDYHPGDEDIPGSPDYDPRQRLGRGGRMSDEERRQNFIDDQASADAREKRDRLKHEAKITDVKYEQDHVHGKQYAPVITQTGIASDRAAAQREIARVEYVAYHKYGNDIQELPDGRFKFMIKYMM